jgi:short subunit dehydrogenase-like uncharacterized protein
MVATGRARSAPRRDVLPVPHFDPWIDTWVGPFFMAPTNTWVVRRSEAIFATWGRAYPSGFSYQEFLKYDPPLASAKAIAASTAIGAFGFAMRVPFLFRTLERFLPSPGSGPSEARMDGGWFSCELVGRTSSGVEARALIRNAGDAGNRSTVKMLCESALCLALGQCTGRGGILTPATAFGDRLVSRLRAADMTVNF